ncbi:PH domain-containing protein [Staphylococcus simulans]|uniref:PH domain-containing protein n=1 Tax=Staphylococcus simulans TaxID=1286 RepID=UPI000D025FEE|nr:PH domain-containing protein [Staphylococcus simulans]
MILDKVNPDDLFPTESQQASVSGKMGYPMNGEIKIFEAAYVATNERLILNVDMAGEFYYRNIAYNEIKAIELKDDTLNLTFEIGTFKLTDFNKADAESFKDYVIAQIQ